MIKDLAPQPSLFLDKLPLIDVRAPVEFAAGHLPGAINLPLLNDEERAAVGTEYKRNGQEAAVALGHKLVSGENKARKISAWRDYVSSNPEAVFYCFRGGMRSQLSRSWLAAEGIERPLLVGGYKAARAFLLDQIVSMCSRLEFVVIAGATGSGKTELIEVLGGRAINLEKLANHRGSAFGGKLNPQPAQAGFENALAVELLSKNGRIYLEDESRMIGKITLPAALFIKLRESPVILVEEPLEQRVKNIRREYVTDVTDVTGSPYPALKNAVFAISRKLGSVRTAEIAALLEQRDDTSWISRLLEYYYDPLYLAGLNRRSPKILLKGSKAECLEALQTGLPSSVKSL